MTSMSWSGNVIGSVELGYDNDFRLVQETVNQATPIALGYDNDSMVSSAGAFSVFRSAQNALVTNTALDQLTDSYTYSTFGEVSGYEASFGNTATYTLAFERDALGRIKKKTETIGGTTTVYQYAYDLAGRLKEVKTNGSVASTYGYDGNGNRLSHATSNGTTSGSYDNQDRLLSYGSLSFTYAANGELSSKTDNATNKTTSYVYDVFGNLTKVTQPNGDVIDYLADPEDRRIQKKVNGTIERAWIYKDELRPIAELDANGNVVARFVYALGRNVPDYMIKGGKTYRIFTDQVGSVRLVVDAATGIVAQRIDYDEFGVVLSDTSPGFQPFGFAGGLYDPDTGLVRFGARDYDAKVGRWTAKDPIRFRGGDANLYGYVLNDPINFRDQHGQGISDVLDFLANLLAYLLGGPSACVEPVPTECNVHIKWCKVSCDQAFPHDKKPRDKCKQCCLDDFKTCKEGGKPGPGSPDVCAKGTSL
jgi:RHS repeat-associated protein